MRELQVAGLSIKINTEKLSEGLYNLHAEADKLDLLAFGMLDAGLCEMFEKHLLSGVKSKFSLINNELFKDRIEQFSRLL